ncbi:MAG: flavodoxin family protein [Pseudomonadota bacterium]
MQRKLLFVCHSPSPNTRALREACVSAIGSLSLERIEVLAKTPLETSVDDVISCSAVLIGTTENFGALAGLTKDFFERIYYPCLDKTQGLPVALYIRAGEDGRGSRVGAEKIMTGLRWRLVAEPLVLRGAYQQNFEGMAAELAMTLAAGLDAEIF